MKRILVVLLLMLFVTVYLSAQSGSIPKVIVKGQVVDSVSAESIPYATIKIVMTQNPEKVLKMLACDIDGKFETDLLPGSYRMTINSIGMYPAVKNVTLSKDSGKQLNLGRIVMQENVKNLAEVVITAQRPLVKAEIDKLTYNIEQDPEAVTSTTLDMLRKVPMITVDGEDNIQLKGSSNFKIYMNGKPSNLITNNPGDVLKSMPANSVKSVEVITEPGAKYDAEGVGGIINIITKSALEGYTATVRANADNFGSVGGGAYLSLKTGKLGITGNYNYNYRNSPFNDSYSFRENLQSDQMKYLTQTGRTKRKGPRQFGYLEASYEIDTLNLLSLSAHRFNGSSRNISNSNELMENYLEETVYSFDRNSNSRSNFGGTEVNLDFQHSTSLKDELLTISYKFNNSPDGSDNTTLIENITGDYLLDYTKDISDNRASTNEHTGQVDYTRPFLKNQTVEAGLKYIYRLSNSETERYRDDELHIEPNQDFRHTQHIYSAYASYNIKVKKFGFKAGARAEGTSMYIKMDKPFSSDYFDLVPSATASYQLSMSQNIRLGYNMRIQRPGISFLNPYIDNSDPLNIRYGNENLNSEKSHNIEFNYGMFSQKFNINASLNYAFVNNAIEQFTVISKEDPDISETTYGNIGHNQNVGLFLYASWMPVSGLRIFMNGGLDYRMLKSDNYGDNNGFNYRLFTGAEYSLPLDFRINLRGGYFAPRILLQGKSSPFYFTGITINKDFMDKKLTVSLSCEDPFWKRKKMESTTADDNFYRRSVNYMTARSFRISISYRFGDLKSTIKKVKRGISNDDVMSGDSDNQSSAQ